MHQPDRSRHTLYVIVFNEMSTKPAAGMRRTARVGTPTPRKSHPRETGAKSCDSVRNDPSLSIRLSPEAR